MDGSEVLTVSVSEAARVLGISRTSAYECVRRGELRAVRLGRRLLVPRAAITELLAGTTNPEPPLSDGSLSSLPSSETAPADTTTDRTHTPESAADSFGTAAASGSAVQDRLFG